MNSHDLAAYQHVQAAARYTLDQVTTHIKHGMSELDLIEICDQLQREAGVEDYWFKDIPALVLAGEHTCLAISKTAYIPSHQPIQEHDLVTIDLNPAIAGYCGDYARTYYIEDGVASRDAKFDAEFLAGSQAQQYLHGKLMQMASPVTTFGEIFALMQHEIDQLGFEMLDNIGHVIQKDMSTLEYIAPNNPLSLAEAGFFTLEPQLKLKGGRYGVKHENIYYFQGENLMEL
jgi:Xaa-Pro aminopeptidase